MALCEETNVQIVQSRRGRPRGNATGKLLIALHQSARLVVDTSRKSIADATICHGGGLELKSCVQLVIVRG